MLYGKIMIQKGGMHCSIAMMEQPFFSPSQIRPFSPQCLFQPFYHLQIIFLVHHLAIRWKFMMNYALTIKKNTVSTTSALDQTCHAL